MYMKRKNKLLVVCLLCLLTLSIGYALFSETITINGTATAKGNFDIEFTCEKGASDEIWPYIVSASKAEGSFLYYEYPRDNGFSNDLCQITNNKMTFSATLDYPGAVRYFIDKATNTGTIAAGIDDTYAYYGGTNSTKTCTYNKSNNSLINCQSSSIISMNGLTGQAFLIAAEDEYGNLYGWDNVEIEEKYMDSNMVWNIKPNESFYFVYFLAWDSKWSDNSKYLSYEMTGELPFVQYNK